MKEKIENKIAEVVEYIINKPASEVTLDDYTILTNERQDIRAKDSQADSAKRMAELMAMVAAPADSVYGTVR